MKVFQGKKAPIGMTGLIFWIGDNKYGEGKRIGLQGDDGETYWIPMDDVQPSAEVQQTESSGPEPTKGANVKWGREGGEKFGTVFWLGPAKNGTGNRIGVNDQGGETHWLSARQVSVIDSLPAHDEPPSSASSPVADAPDMPDGPTWDSAPDYGDSEDDAPPPVWNDSAAEPVWDDDDPLF